MAAEPGTKWTEAQLAGIQTTGCNLLLSAAAGSGKTAVLAERCAYLVCDAPDPCGVDELLVVTYTEAAAAEMKSRIEQALRKRLDNLPDPQPGDTATTAVGGQARLHRQLALVERAQVSTLHGFCARLLRQHFHLLGLDPSFAILDAGDATLLRNETVRDLFLQRYETDDHGHFRDFVDGYGDGNDAYLQKTVVRAHDLLRSLVDSQQWLDTALANIIEAGACPLNASALGDQFLAEVAERLERLIQRCLDGIRLLLGMTGFDKYSQQFGELLITARSWRKVLDEGGLDALAAAVAAFTLPRKPNIRDNVPGKEIAVAALDAVRDSMKAGNGAARGSVLELARFSEAQWRQGMRMIRQPTQIFLDLVSDFGQAYRDAKDKSRGLDFADLEIYALRLLRAGDRDASPSAVACLCQSRYRHVLVDEYQDINEVQDAILSLVSRATPAANLFCVGDVKQSIYRFRLAEPRRFLARYDQFKALVPAGTTAPGKVIDLQSNFRSRAPLLEVINGVFRRLMTRQGTEIEYDVSHELRPGLAYPPAAQSFIGAPVELHLLSNDAGDHVADSEDADDPPDGSPGSDAAELDRTQREALFVARRICNLVNGPSPMHVMEKGPDGCLVPRPIRFRDIVILLRSMHQKADQFADILRKQEVPVHRESRTGFFRSTEIQDILSLLRILDNPQQDIHLAAVLRSPLGRLTDCENSLARVVLAYPPAGGSTEPLPFHRAVVRYGAEHDDELAAHLRQFLQKLERWRQQSRQRPLAETIWTIYAQTGYLAFVSGLPNGQQRTANLMSLHERARQFGSFSRQGLYRFLKFMETLADESDLGQPSVLSEADDVVRIMSIHRAKGLEFPVVILPDLGKRFNLEDCSGRILVDRARHVGLVVADLKKRARYLSMASFLVRDQLLRQSLAEELRVLYVAMTRAKEHLILVGTCKQARLEGWSRQYAGMPGPLPTDQVLSATMMLDWIGPVCAAAGAGSFAITFHSSEAIQSWKQFPMVDDAARRRAQLAVFQPLDPPPPANPLAQRIITALTTKYAYARFVTLPASQSVSVWTKHNPRISTLPTSGTIPDVPPSIQSVAAEAALPLPRFLLESECLSAAEIGTATHLVLEHLDFARPCSGPDLDDQIAGMLQRHLFNSQQAAAVNRQAIAWLMAEELGMLIKQHAAEVIRELPFNLAVSSALAPPASDLQAHDLDQIMIRGRIDLLIPRNGAFLVVDYKTDRVPQVMLDARAEFYDGQVQFYRRAVKQITGHDVVGVYLVFLAARQIRKR